MSGIAVAAAFYFIVNPYFFGDATWYATDLWNGTLRLDSGHLLWRPAAAALRWAFGLHGTPLDALVALRVLSSVFTVVLCLGTYRLARRLALSPLEGLLATSIVGGSQACLAYGGSGCSYTAAMAMVVLALLPIFPHEEREWGPRDAGLSAVAILAGWSVWTLAILMFPAIAAAAFLNSEGTSSRRALRAIGLCVPTLVAIVGMSWVVYFVFGDGGGLSGYLTWLASSSHGQSMRFSLLGLSRVPLGFCASFVSLGSLGTWVKGLLLRDPALSPDGVLVPALAVTGFVAIVVAACVGFFRRQRAAPIAHRRMLWVLVAALLPAAAFGAAWKGSDIERLAFSVPLVSVVVVAGLGVAPRVERSRGARLGTWLAWSLVAIIWSTNFALFVGPRLASRGGIAMSLGRVARQHMPEGSLLIVTGQDLGPDVSSTAIYFGKVDVFGILYDVRVSGADGWSERMSKAIASARERGGHVAVLSDLIGEMTPGGIGLSTHEYPVPSLEDVRLFFSGWKIRESWKVDRYTFLELEPPAREAD